MITLDKSRRIFQLVSQLNSAASALVAGVRPCTVCAWCRQTIRQGPLPISHTICLACSEQFKTDGAL